MKYGMIAGLLAAIGAVAFAGQSHAGNRYCSYFPEDPNCYQLLYGQGSTYQAPGDDYNDEEVDGADVNYQPSPPLRPVVRPAKSCEGVGRELRQFGYRHVRAIACSGPSYKYVAYLGHQRFMVKVNSHSGAIIYEINY
jgi:hypothetical protein